MARGTLVPQQIARAGIVPAYTAADEVNGHEFVNEGEKTLLHVKNASVAPINVTFPTPGLVDGLAVADLVVAVANASEKMIGPFPTSIYNQTGGKVYVDISEDTTVTLAVFKL